MILNKEVISLKMLENFVPLLDDVGQDFVARVHKKIKRNGQNKWTTDLSQELFKYALECKTCISPPFVSVCMYAAILTKLFVFVSSHPPQLWAQYCMGSVWVYCWTTSTLKPSTSLTASPSCSKLPRPCCTYPPVCSGALDQRCGGTTWTLGMGYSTKVRLLSDFCCL